MATGQTILDTMEMLNQELQLQSGEADVTRGLVALNRAQDYLEALAATAGKSLQTKTTVTQTAGQDYSARPAGLLRIDRLQLLDANSRVLYALDVDKSAGGRGSLRWPLTAGTASTVNGKPLKYSYDEDYLYWTPAADTTNVIRVIGLIQAADITANGTFAYKDPLILPLAAFAVRLMRIGVDDQVPDIGSLAQETFGPILKALSTANRDSGGGGFEYTESHSA